MPAERLPAIALPTHEWQSSDTARLAPVGTTSHVLLRDRALGPDRDVNEDAASTATRVVHSVPAFGQGVVDRSLVPV
jgi:hypothetical protein